MALGDRKIPEVFNKKTGGSKDARSITSERELEIKAEYDAGVHVADDGMFNTIAPALYAIQKLSEDIDELRRYITAEITSITSSQASAITANTAKRTSPTWVPSSNPSYLTSSSTQSKYLRSDADDYFSGKLNWDGSDYADGINMSLGNINDAHYVDANEYRQRLSGMPRNNLGDPTVTEMALFEEQFGPKTTLANDYDDLSDLTFWGQETSSSDWVEITSYSDDQKRRFLRTNNSSIIIPNTYYKFRVEFTAKSYTFANAVYMYWSSQSHSSQVHVWKKRCSDGTWIQHTSATNTISSWPGHGWVPFSNIPWHETNTTSTGHFTHIRVEFTPNWSGHATYGDRNINLYGMQIWGGYPTGRRTPHYYDQNGEFNFLKDAHLQDGKVLKLGTSNDLMMQHDGSHSYISQSGTGNLYIQQNTNNSDMVFQCDDGSGGTSIYMMLDGSESRISTKVNNRFDDNVKLELGTSGDLQLLHDGSNSYIHHIGAGSLYMKADTGDINIINYTNDRDIVLSSDDGSGGTTSYLTLDGSTTHSYFSAGNVGIGQTDPQTLLHLTTAMSSSPTTQLYLDVDGSNVNGGGGEIIFNTSASAGSPTSYNAKITGTRVSGGTGGDSQLGFWTTLVSSSQNPQERMTITKEGNVGIGTSSPDYKLEVVDGAIMLKPNTAGAALTWRESDDGNIGGQLRSYSNRGDIYLYTDGVKTTEISSLDDSFIPRLHVGGTNQASATLQVTGNIDVSGTVDGRDIATDGTKLDTVATNADVTPSWVPSSDPGYGTSNLALGTTSTTALAGDTVTITTAQAAILTNLANLPTRPGASGTFWNNRGILAIS